MLIGKDMARETSRITLDPAVRDKMGMPVASVHFDARPNDVAMRAHAAQQGSAICSAVGAARLIPTPPYPSTHNMGTNRMSEKPRDGGINRFGQTHDIKNLFVSDGSQFTSGAACNPTLTIVSLAILQADTMARMVEQREIRPAGSYFRTLLSRPLVSSGTAVAGVSVLPITFRPAASRKARSPAVSPPGVPDGAAPKGTLGLVVLGPTPLPPLLPGAGACAWSAAG